MRIVAWITTFGLLGSTAGAQAPSRPPAIDVHVAQHQRASRTGARIATTSAALPHAPTMPKTK